MKKILISLMAMISALAACGENCSSEPAPGKPNKRENIELTKEQQEFVAKGNEFALKLIGKLYKEKSFICSPLSLQFALGMVNAGARGATSDEICAMLGYGTGDPEAVNAYAKLLADALASVDNTTRMDIANVLVYNTHDDNDGGIRLKEPYIKALNKYYDAGIETFDFTTENQKALGRINGWCAEKTNGMIPSILGQVSPLALCYILNAVYFKGIWANKFNKSSTREQDFYPEKGASKKVEMMRITEDFAYSSNETWKTLTMPYGNKAFRLTAFLPQSGKTVSDVLARLDASALDFATRRAYFDEIIVAFPKFETASELPLNDVLKELGMKKVFKSGAADLKGMCESASNVSNVFQKAKIKLDEEGTEAAAVTVVQVDGCTAIPNPPEPKRFIADHPFLYVITEVSTGAVIFAGCYAGD